MTKTYGFKVVAPHGVIVDKQLEQVVFPAIEGKLGVLPDHAPLLTLVLPGIVRYREQGEWFIFRMEREGVLYVKPSETVLLTEGGISIEQESS